MNPKIKKIIIKLGNLQLFNNILSQHLEANKTKYFISKEIKQYTKGNKIRLKGNKTLGLVIFLLASRSPKTYGPMRWSVLPQCLYSEDSLYINQVQVVVWSFWRLPCRQRLEILLGL